MNKNQIMLRQQPCLTDKSNTARARKSGFGWVSGNWSGYAITGKQGAFHRISGEWIVPCVKPTLRPTYSSAWIGIDGFRNSSLIQTGTGHEFVGGNARYYAWWEILPAAETVIPLPVRPGDRIRATIVKLRGGKWSITLCNRSRKWTFRTIQRYSGAQSSGEWIMEAPQVDGSIAKLARVSTTRFINCRINGKRPGLMQSMGGIMVQNNATVAIPSCPGRSGDSFAVRRLYPSNPPLINNGVPLLFRYRR